MKGMSFLEGQSPMKKMNTGGKKKTIAGEDTDIIKTDKKGKDYALSMFDQASGINKGDTLFTPKHKIPSVYGYVRGGENYDAVETEDSKKRNKGPKSYTLKTQPAPTKLKKKSKKKKQDFKPAYPGADISKAEYDKARKAGVTSEAEYAKYKAKMKKKKKSPAKYDLSTKKGRKDYYHGVDSNLIKKNTGPRATKGFGKSIIDKYNEAIDSQKVEQKTNKAYKTLKK